MTVFIRDGTAKGWFSIERTAVKAIKTVPEITGGPRKNVAIIRSTYMALVDLANAGMGKGTKCSHKDLIDEAGAQRTSIQTALKYLQLAQVIEVNETFDVRGQAENEYVIVDPPSDESAKNGTPPPSHEHPGARHTSTPLLATRAPRCSPHEHQTQEEEEEGEREAQRASEMAPIDNSPVAVLCARLAELRAPFDSNATLLATSAAWVAAAEQLLSSRGGSLGEILEVVRWVSTDPFWLPQVLDPSDLARNYPRLLAKQLQSFDTPKPAPKTQHGRQLQARRERTAQLLAAAGTCCVGDGPPCPAEADWARTAAALRSAIGDEVFDVWLASAHAHTGTDGELLIAVNEEVHEWVSERFERVIQTAAQRPVEVVVCQEAITA